MSEKPVERKLAAILAADIAGYSRLMAHDEIGTVAKLKACRAVVDQLISTHRGRIFNTAGDSVVVDFASAVDAVACAVAVQTVLAAKNAGGDGDESLRWRIGIHVGDIIVDGDNLLGDGVNIAARLEALAEPGTICVSAAAHGQIGNKLLLAYDDLGAHQVKNIPAAIRAYRVRPRTADPESSFPNPPPPAGEGRVRAAEAPALALPDKPSIAVLPFQNLSGDPEQEPVHAACCNCFKQGKISPLHASERTHGTQTLTCNGCGAKLEAGLFTPPAPRRIEHHNRGIV